MKRNFWPYAIILYFAIFITAMTAWIFFAVRNDQELVRRDYYEHELKFQTELDSLNRAAGEKPKVTYTRASQTIAIALPKNAEKAVANFYRPSSAALDRKIEMTGPFQTINANALQPGLWKLQLTWTAAGVAYRHDETLVL